ncbi:MAG: ComF family protein [Gemmatimonadales bacterium]
MRLSSARSARDAAVQLLLPAECLLCRHLLVPAESDRIVCAVCRHRWRPVRPPWCARCGQPEPLFGPCRLCRDWPEALRAVRSAVWLVAGAHDAVAAFKYRGLSRIAADLASVIAQPWPVAPADAVLVPVPLAPGRLRARGYNQSAVLAAALGARWGVPMRELLRRTRETPTQTALTPEKRLANVAGAFQLRIDDCGLRIDGWPVKSAIRNPQSAIVLVDDVFTTGATLAEAARALERAGARAIYGVTFARAAIPDFT